MAFISTNRNSFLKTEPYLSQKSTWPKHGKYVLAHYDENTVVVYQAFKQSIADYAVKHQRFAGDFSFQRMSWIKTNFLWMMYRCGWAQKPNQERVLAVKVSRENFDTILKHAYTAELQKSQGLTSDDVMVRLQWDPDHDPWGEKETRRAIQLGLKNDILKNYATQWIVEINDITDFVKEQYQILHTKGEGYLLTPCEQVYPVSPDVKTQIGSDS